MANEALSVLQIDPKTLEYFDRYDKKLETIAKNSTVTANTINTAFKSLKDGVSPLIAALTQIQDKLGAIGTASGGVNTAAQSVGNMGRQAQQTNTSLTQTAQLLNQLNASKNSPTNAVLGMYDLTPAQNKLASFKQQIETVRQSMASLLSSKLGGNITAQDIRSNGIAQYLQALRQLKAEQDKASPYLFPQAARNSAEIAQIIRLVTQLGGIYSQTAAHINSASAAINNQTASNQAIAQMVAKTGDLKNKIVECEAEFERLKAGGNAYDKNGGMSSAAKSVAEKKRGYEEELRLINQTSAEALRAEDKKTQAAEKDAQRRTAAAEKSAAQQQKSEEAALQAALRAMEERTKAQQRHQAQLRRQGEQQVAQTTRGASTTSMSYGVAIQASKDAKTLRDEIAAVKMLEQALLNLSKTDGAYKTKLEAINNAIRQHNASLQQAGVQSSSLEQWHRNLMDITGQLARKFALLFSVSQVQGYIGQIAKVRGEFELQQRSLEAILQNKTEADAIFQKTVDLAIKSPFQIKELVSYTKQLAAYRIEGDKLYDTTKRLADVSAGLGVDMQRLILAYGQVKAAAYLRGCLGIDTEIVMYDGSRKKVQDVSVGELLRGDDDKPRTVKELIRGREQMYSVSGNGYTYRVNQNHILTLFSIKENKVVDVYVSDYLNNAQNYLGVRYNGNAYTTYRITVTKDKVDDYFGFVIDGNKRFLIGDNVVTHNTEVRQFTEAGVNMYGELQSYFQEVKGEAYTTAQIVDMISKRKVTFEDVEAVFQRLTDKGGLFYNMQEIQSETLNGKIANLKDSIDAMLNDIGKGNEGILKGTVDVVGLALKHWESFAAVMKAAIAVFAALKVQALLSSQWIRLLAIDVGVLTNTIPKALTLTQAFRVGLNALTISIKKVGVALKTFATAHPVLLAITVALSAAWRAANAFTATKKALSENIKEYDKTAASIKKCAGEFTSLNAAAQKAKEGGIAGFDFKKNFEQQKAQLSSLYKIMDENHVMVKVELQSVSEKNIKDVFEDARRRVSDDARMKLDVSNFIAADDTSAWSNVAIGLGDLNFGHINDSFSVQMKDADEAADAIRNWSTQASDAINTITVHYKELTPAAKTAFDSIKNGAENGEPEAVYLQRVAGAWQTIRNEMDNLSDTPDWVGDTNWEMWNIWDSLVGDADKLRANQKRAEEDINAMLDDLIAKNKERLSRMSDAEKLSFFDAVAEKQKYSEYQEWLLKKVASERLKFKIDIDRDHQEQQIDWAKKNLKDSLDGTKINVDIELNKDFLSSVFEQVDAAQKYLKNVDKYKDFAKGGRKRKVTWGEVKNDTEFVDWYQNTYRANNANVAAGRIKDSMEITDFTINNYISAQEKKARAIVEASNQEIEADKKNNKKRANEAAKNERDIWNERISVLKEMQQRYESIREYMGEDAAIKNVRDAYGAALANVNMGKVIKTEDIVPTKEGLVAALEKILKAMPTTMKDYFKKSQDLKNTIATLKIDIDKERLKKSLKEVKEETEDLFVGLDLYKKLKEAGLGDAIIKDLFPNISKDFTDVETGINVSYSTKFPEKEYTQKGTEAYKQYQDDIAKLNQKRVQDQKDTLVELVKNYKNKISELAQIDAWYYSEYAKITGSVATPSLKEELYRNLDKMRNEKQSSAIWSEFKDSGSYTTLFGDLSNVSTASLDKLDATLDTLRNSLSALDPTQVKEIVKATEQIHEIKAERSPFKTLIEDLQKIRELRAQGITEESLDATIAGNDSENAQLQNEIAAINNIIQAKREGRELDNSSRQFLEQNTQYESMSLEQLQGQVTAKENIVKANKKENAAAQKNKKVYSDARVAANQTKQAISQLVGQLQSAASAGAEMADALGASEETKTYLELFQQLIGIVGQLIVLFVLLGVAVNSSLGIIGLIIAALEAVIALFTALIKAHDNRLQEQIDELQDEVDLLAEKFDNLKEAMDNAWTTDSLVKYKNAAEQNIDAQIANYKAMIAAEKAKKKTDDDKIKEYQKTIRELQETRQELQESALEAAGGFGSDENIQSAAQEFADAWVDAYNEGEDALDALNDKWDEYVTNLIKKQAMLRVVGAAIEPLLEKVDEYVSEQSAGGIKLTQDELAKLQAQADALLPSLNESLSDLMNTLNYTGTSADDNLDALQQGIEGVSEQTADALESILNSIRFFLAIQQGDVAIIRTLLESMYGSTSWGVGATDVQGSDSASNPMLVELKAQTGYLRKLSDNFDGCFAYSNQSKGKGLRVFVQ